MSSGATTSFSAGTPGDEQMNAKGGVPSAVGGVAGATQEATSPAGAGGMATVDCGSLPEGAYCGEHWVGADASMRYFCADGSLVAQAKCPGSCDGTLNECKTGTGTGQGTGDSGIGLCPECFEGPCAAEFAGCDALCRAHIRCSETCSFGLECYAICEAVFTEDKRLAPLIACAATACKTLCEGTQ